MNNGQNLFDYSQEIRPKIESSHGLLLIVRGILTKNREAELLGEGTTNKIYSIGRTDTGLYVALRVNMHAHTKPELAKRYYETYGITAERLSVEGKRATRFCIGAMVDEIPSILIEDLTHGGTEPIHSAGADYGVYKSTGQRVEFDLDDVNNFRGEKYFADGAYIKIR